MIDTDKLLALEKMIDRYTVSILILATVILVLLIVIGVLLQ